MNEIIMRRPDNYIQIIIKLISRWTFGNNDKNVTKMNNDGAIQPLLLIVVEEYRCYCHRLNESKMRRNLRFPYGPSCFTSSGDTNKEKECAFPT